jgi:hypothetical protein
MIQTKKKKKKRFTPHGCKSNHKIKFYPHFSVSKNDSTINKHDEYSKHNTQEKANINSPISFKSQLLHLQQRFASTTSHEVIKTETKQTHPAHHTFRHKISSIDNFSQKKKKTPKTASFTASKKRSKHQDHSILRHKQSSFHLAPMKLFQSHLNYFPVNCLNCFNSTKQLTTHPSFLLKYTTDSKPPETQTYSKPKNQFPIPSPIPLNHI